MGQGRLRIWGIGIAIAMGFVVGLVLSGIGDARTGLYAHESRALIDSYRLEDYWQGTDLIEYDLRQLVNNEVCATSEKYFLACVNSVISALSMTHERLSVNGQILPSELDFNSLDNFKEKQNLQAFSKIYKDHLSDVFSFDEIWDQIVLKSNNQQPKKYLLAQGINGFLSVMKDPHTYILPLNYFENVSSSSERSPYFVGLSFEKINGHIFIKKVVKNSDAELAGLQQNDEIVIANGIEAAKLSLTDIGQILRDKKIRIFSFIIRREGLTIAKKVQRTYRVLNQINHEIVDLEEKTGLIQISKFSNGTCTEVKNILKEFKQKNISQIVIDLRDNPGGRLSEAACLAGLFIGPDKKVYTVKYFDSVQQEEIIKTENDKMFSGSLAILINSNSASASELLAGALQEYQRAVIIGNRSFGKGTFQEIEQWKESATIGYFKTKGFYLLPSGQTTQFYGVEPDVFVEGAQQTISNEEINYINPIRPEQKYNIHPQIKQRSSKLLNECSNVQKSVFIENFDHVLSKAIEVLNCEQTTLKTAQQNQQIQQL